MNCPVCKQGVGTDQSRVGPEKKIRDEHGQVADLHRTLFIECDFCGEMEVTLNFRGHIISRRGPFTQTRDVRRVQSNLPCNLGHKLAS